MRTPVLGSGGRGEALAGSVFWHCYLTVVFCEVLIFGYGWFQATTGVGAGELASDRNGGVVAGFSQETICTKLQTLPAPSVRLSLSKATDFDYILF